MNVWKAPENEPPTTLEERILAAVEAYRRDMGRPYERPVYVMHPKAYERLKAWALAHGLKVEEP